MNPSVILAYSGGLDTTICVHWLQQKGYKVIPFLAQLGQAQYLEPAGEKALNVGADTVHICDLRERFIKEFIFPTLKADARYDSSYLLSSALSRPLIAEELVRVASEENCFTVAHGARSFGNDHIRFKNAVAALNPKLKILAPLKELGLETMTDGLDYAKKYNLPVERLKKIYYNTEENLWGMNIQLGPVTDSTKEVPKDSYYITTPLPETPDKPTVLEIKFEKGEPVELDGKNMKPLDMIMLLNKIGGRNAIGRVEMVENRIAGGKTYDIYEEPAATILYDAHRALEEIILDRNLLHYKTNLSQTYAELVYNGHWFRPLRKSLGYFFEHVQRVVSGSVKIKLYKGNLLIIGRKIK